MRSGGLTMRLTAEARTSVVFFGVPGESGTEYGGTGFLLADRFDDQRHFTFLVTARHVARALEKYDDTGFVIRLNRRDGGSEPIEVQKVDWFYHPDESVDLAVAHWAVDWRRFEVTYYEVGESGHGIAPRTEVMCGDLVSIVGLFRLHAGSKRNVPFVHTGHVAVLPDASERVPIRDRTTDKIIEAEVYLVEAQTLDGLSGSPVFYHSTGTLENFPHPKNGVPLVYTSRVKLLGIYTGSWDGEPGVILAADRNLRGNKRVPVGMGTVVPVEKLLELIREHPEVKKQREEAIQELLSQRAASSDSALSAPPATGANPQHREDFTSLLNAAARKRPQGDQT
jgi:hypothetical protein